MSQSGSISGGGSGTIPGTVPESFVTNSGTATASNNVLNVLGGTGITTSGSGNTVTITASLPNTSTPAFNASYNIPTVSNITGDGTVYFLVPSQIFANQTNSYNGSTGIFTAPKAGVYYVQGFITLSNMNSSHTLGHLDVYQNGSSVNRQEFNPFAGASTNNNFSFNLSLLMQLSQNDTIQIATYVQGGTKTINLTADNGGGNYTGFTMVQVA